MQLLTHILEGGGVGLGCGLGIGLGVGGVVEETYFVA
jgi:hypothetical protein